MKFVTKVPLDGSVTILNLCHQVAFKEWVFNLDFQSWNSITLERA